MPTTPFLVPHHMGDLHAWEQVFVLLLAFGPFILLGAVVFVVRRRDVAEEQASATENGEGSDVPGL